MQHKVFHLCDATPALAPYTVRMTKGRRFFLREWRAYRGMTQQQLADATGHTKGYISNLERGESRYNEDVLEACAKALNCEPGDLLTRDPTQQESNEPAEIVNIWNHILPENRGQARQILKTFTDKKKA